MVDKTLTDEFSYLYNDDDGRPQNENAEMYKVPVLPPSPTDAGLAKPVSPLTVEPSHKINPSKSDISMSHHNNKNQTTENLDDDNPEILDTPFEASPHSQSCQATHPTRDSVGNFVDPDEPYKMILNLNNPDNRERQRARKTALNTAGQTMQLFNADTADKTLRNTTDLNTAPNNRKPGQSGAAPAAKPT